MTNVDGTAGIFVRLWHWCVAAIAEKAVVCAMVLVCAMAYLPTIALASDSSLRAALKDQVFDPARDALQEANKADAAILTPETYRRAGELFKRAEELFQRGADVDRVRKVVFESRSLFEQAAVTAPTVQAFVSDAFEARRDALDAQARTRSPELFQEAEVALYEATSRAEKGRERQVARYADKAQTLFRDAELAAIENVLFAQIDAEIAKAKELDADDWAPVSYQQAVTLLAKAREVLSNNRYDTDEPRNLARQSLHQALHAQYVARLADDIDDNDTSLEVVLLNWEEALAPLGEAVDVPLYFDHGPQDAINFVVTALSERDARMAALAEEVSRLRSRNRLLGQEMLVLQSELEDREAAQARLDRRLLEQQEREALVNFVENLFTDKEAEVVRHENRLVVRLVGLGFASGSASLEARHSPMLEKLREALEVFPDTPITIEGHTDAYGADETNMQLSIRRADAVAEYVLDHTAVQAEHLTSVGYGETRPIANNETADGRWKNRRIDVVIYPFWWSN